MRLFSDLKYDELWTEYQCMSEVALEEGLQTQPTTYNYESIGSVEECYEQCVHLLYQRCYMFTYVAFCHGKIRMMEFTSNYI